MLKALIGQVSIVVQCIALLAQKSRNFYIFADERKTKRIIIARMNI